MGSPIPEFSLSIVQTIVYRKVSEKNDFYDVRPMALIKLDVGAINFELLITEKYSNDRLNRTYS